MGLCRRCGKEIERLFDGLCTACMCEDSIVEERKQSDNENDLHGLSLGEPFKDGEFAAIAYSMKNHTTGNKRSTQAMGSEDVIKEEDSNAETLALQMRLNEKERKIFDKALKKVVAEYWDDIEQEKVGVCKMTQYGVTCGGTLITNIGGLAVYKATEYFDDDKYDPSEEEDADFVDPGEYEEGTELIDELAYGDKEN